MSDSSGPVGLSKRLPQLRIVLQLADREWKKLLKRKDELSSAEVADFKKLITIRRKLHSEITKLEIDSNLMNQLLKKLGAQ